VQQLTGGALVGGPAESAHQVGETCVLGAQASPFSAHRVAQEGPMTV
jgi:hypothetical protein